MALSGFLFCSAKLEIYHVKNFCGLGDDQGMKSNVKQQTREEIFNFYAKHRQECDENYELAEDENISNIYDYIDDETIKNTLFAKTSAIILTANKYERNILHKRVYQRTAERIKKFEIELATACERYNKIYAYWFDWNGYSTLHIHANVTGSYTIGGSADIIRWILLNKYLFPVVIISFGICFGTEPQSSELGDVIISKKVYPYFIGAKINGKELQVVDDNVFEIDWGLHNKINDLRNNNKFKGLRVKFKNYITGEAVINSESVRDKFTHITTQEIFAGDMEGYGLFKECKNGKCKIPCMVLKSICDWGTEKNFNEKDEKTLLEFKKAIKHTLPTSNSEENILKSLKDRLQAFSANCAFNVLEVMINNGIFSPSILDCLKEWLVSYTGVATSCKFVKKTICNLICNAQLGDTVSDSFVHRCLIILADEGLVQCEPSCMSNRKVSNDIDDCIHLEKNASIEITKG